MIDTLAGLHAAHELAGDDGAPFNLVHRDVSPANILVGVDGVVRLTDFGVARAETRLSSTRGGKLKGKIPYMPPEQLMGQPIDRRCDIYSAGVVMWESLVGRRLFHADSEGALLQRILSGPAQSIRQLLPNTPAALDAVCMRALSHDLSERYQTAADFSDAIEAAASASAIPIASARAVAKFVAECGAHKKLDLRELAALKSSPSASVPSLRSPLDSYPSFPDRTPISSPLATPSSQPMPSVPSIASGPSGASVPSMTSAPSSVTDATGDRDRRARGARRARRRLLLVDAQRCTGGTRGAGRHGGRAGSAGFCDTRPSRMVSMLNDSAAWARLR
jgi:serine/threonine-protein kinase